MAGGGGGGRGGAYYQNFTVLVLHVLCNNHNQGHWNHPRTFSQSETDPLTKSMRY